MSLSPFYKSLRERIGHSLLLVPGAAGIIRDDARRILLQELHDGSWSLPAGITEPGESPAAAVVREVLEETGLRVRPRRILAVVGGSSYRVVHENGDEVEYVVTVFECDVVGGSLVESNEETRSLRYFPQASMPRLKFAYPEEVFDESRSSPYFAPA